MLPRVRAGKQGFEVTALPCARLAGGAMGGETEPGRGRLYLVATPIGNLADITLRALAVLHAADAIACEDTRQTRKLLDRHGIDRPLISYHEHNELTRARELVDRLTGGATIALVSDAGMPLVCDPGRH